MKKIIIAFLICFLLSGCVATRRPVPVRERLRYVTLHHNLSEQAKRYITAGHIAIGMTKEMVKASWGEPSYIKTESDPVVGNIEKWTYMRSDYWEVVYFVDCKVVNIETGFPSI